jgi:hypothetical protein
MNAHPRRWFVINISSSIRKLGSAVREFPCFPQTDRINQMQRHDFASLIAQLRMQVRA